MLQAGAEKVVFNTYAVHSPNIIKEISENFGSQSLIVSMDVKKTISGKYKVVTNSGKKSTSISPLKHAKNMASSGAREILINSINRDGTMEGYDLQLTRLISEAVDIPVIACSGAGSFEYLAVAVSRGGASATSAGSMFVYYGPRRAVLTNYPEKKVLEKLSLK